MTGRGFEGGVSLHGERTWIPNDRWSILGVEDWSTSTFTGGGLAVYGVLFYLAADLKRIDPDLRLSHSAQDGEIPAMKQCEAWLRSLKKGGPQKAKKHYYVEARGSIKGLSRRQFDYAWAQVFEDDSRWTRPGRRIALIE